MKGRGFPRRWMARVAFAGMGACAASIGAQQPAEWLNFAPAAAGGASFWHPDAGGNPVHRMLESGRGAANGPAAAVVVVPPAQGTAARQDGAAPGDAASPFTLSRVLTDPDGPQGPFAAGEALPASTLLETTVAGARGRNLIPKVPAPQAGQAATAAVEAPAAEETLAQGLSLRPSGHLEQAAAKPARSKRRAR